MLLILLELYLYLYTNKILIDPENSDHLRYKKKSQKYVLKNARGPPSNVSINFDHHIPIVSVLKKTYVNVYYYFIHNIWIIQYPNGSNSIAQAGRWN